MDNNKTLIFEKTWFIFLLFTVITGAIYFNSLHSPFVYDDTKMIAENTDIRSLHNIFSPVLLKYNRPLTYITFVANYSLGKLNTFGYHLFNILLHVINSFLVFLLARELIRTSSKKQTVFFPFLVSLIFITHPVNTETVTYIYNRSAGLSTLFYIAAVLFFIKSTENQKYSFPLSLLFFILSFLAKESAVTLPFILISVDYFFISDFSFKKVLGRKLTYLAYFSVLGLLAAQYFLLYKPAEASDYERYWQGFSYWITQPYVIIKYLRLLVTSSGLSINHFIKKIDTLLDLRFIIPLILIISIFACAIYFTRKRRTDLNRLLLFSVSWFFITLLPTNIRIVNIGERHLYLSGIGFYIGMAALFFAIFRKEAATRWNTYMFAVALVPVCLMGGLTVQRNRLYNEPALLWQDAVDQYPESRKSWYNLAKLLEEKQQYEKAVDSYTHAIDIDPGYAKAYNNRGVLYNSLNKLNNALNDFNKAVEIKRDYAESYLNRANLFFKMGDMKLALADYDRAIMLSPETAEPYFNRGTLFLVNNKYSEAIDDFTKTIGMTPYYPETYFRRAEAYTKSKKYEKALADYEKVLSMNPDFIDAHYGKAYIYKDMKNFAKVKEELDIIKKLGYNADKSFLK